MHQFVIHRSGAFLDLAALNERGLPSMPTDRRMQSLASVQNIQSRRAEILAALQQIAQQCGYYRRVLGRSFAQI
jgi:hypothetical protein